MDKQISVMPCLDMRNGRVVKGVHFVDIRDAGNPVECARAYCRPGQRSFLRPRCFISALSA